MGHTFRLLDTFRLMSLGWGVQNHNVQSEMDLNLSGSSSLPLWNSMPDPIRRLDNYKSFKKQSRKLNLIGISTNPFNFLH